jgi:very-short-patch-repair endonuclease
MIGRPPPPAAPKSGPATRPAVPSKMAGQDTACRVVERASPTLRRLKTQLKCQSLRNLGSLVVHRSARIGTARHPVRTPPRTRIEETALDLAQLARNLDEAVAWLSSACGRRLTTAVMLREAMDARGKMRWRSELSRMLADISDGVHSTLEYRYVRNVERAHRLPVPRRQAKKARGPRSQYLDNDYQDFGVAVELDGRVAHPAEARWADIHRDNCSAASGTITLRYSWADITARPCEVAAEVAAVLRQRGWTGQPAACGPQCPAASGIMDLRSAIGRDGYARRSPRCR